MAQAGRDCMDLWLVGTSIVAESSLPCLGTYKISSVMSQ